MCPASSAAVFLLPTCCATSAVAVSTSTNLAAVLLADMACCELSHAAARAIQLAQANRWDLCGLHPSTSTVRTRQRTCVPPAVGLLLSGIAPFRYNVCCKTQKITWLHSGCTSAGVVARLAFCQAVVNPAILQEPGAWIQHRAWSAYACCLPNGFVVEPSACTLLLALYHRCKVSARMLRCKGATACWCASQPQAVAQQHNSSSSSRQ